jgi:hypothetical protein
MTPVTIAQLRATATVDLMTAARALCLGPDRHMAKPADGSFHVRSSASATPTASPPARSNSSVALLTDR